MLDFYEVKREANRIDLGKLAEKAEAFYRKNPSKRELKSALHGVSLADL